MREKDIETKIRKIVIREMDDCTGKEGSKLSDDRTKLKKKYLGYGYSVDDDRQSNGLSTYVDRSVMEAVEWAKPGLMRVFCNDEIIRFDPRSPQQEQAAQDATTYVNEVAFGRNMFSIVHNVLTDGLYQRVGWCLAHCPEKIENRVDQYTGLSEQEAQAVLMDPKINLDNEKSIEVEQYVGSDGQPAFDLTVHWQEKTRKIVIEPIPSEHVVISSDARDVESAKFIAYWSMKTASDLRKMGYTKDQIEELPTASDSDDMPEEVVTRNINDVHSGDYEGKSEATREYKVYEAWTDIDINDDGIAEKVKVTFVGDAESCKILDWEEWPLYRAPLFAASSVPMPHSAIGLCVADLVSDLQDLRTEIMRQYLDNLALSNQAELVVNEGQSGTVEWDSLLARGVGSVHRLTGDATIQPLKVAAATGEIVNGVTISDSLIERRTGISSRTQSIQADTLQNTATGASIMEESINQRLELIARVYAETFFKPLGRYLLHLMHKYQDKAIQMRIKGRFMQFDPRKWDPDMDISVAVGLGSGNRSKLLATYQQILQIQQAMLQQLGPMSPVHMTHIVYTCHKMAEASGLEAPERFFGSEQDAAQCDQQMAQNAQNGGNPEQQKEQAKLQLEQQKAQAKIQNDKLRMQNDAQIRAYEAQNRMALEKQQAQAKLTLKAMELQGERELDKAKINAGIQEKGLTQLRDRSVQI